MAVVGCLPYLNVKPLSYLLERGGLPPGWSLEYASPAQLAQMLERGDICCAPVSSFACFANPELKIVPGLCIASHGSVNSVLMFSKKRAEKVSTVAVDSGSLSGVAMLKIILAERHGVTPEFVACEPDIDLMLSGHDACLLLGNTAMRAGLAPSRGVHVTDLGHEWLHLTGLPAVFAVWAVGPAAPLADLVPLLNKSKTAGVEALAEIASEESEKLGLPYDVCRNYLSTVMVYDMGPDEIEGLAAFASKAFAHGLLDRPAELRFAEAKALACGQG